MPAEYVCAVSPSHRRSYDLPQDHAPQCCGKPMTMMPDAAAARPASGAAPEPRALPAPGAAALPQKEWWQHWK